MFASSVGSEYHEGVIWVDPETDGIVAVCAEGDVDLTNAPALADEVNRALDGGNHLIVDLSEASFIDSSVIHVLVHAAKTAGSRKQIVVIELGPAAIAERLLELASIEQVMPRARNRQEAVRIIHAMNGAGMGIDLSERAARNQDAFRTLNEQIAPMNASQAWFGPGMPDWYCECADTDCAVPVSMTVTEYEAVRSESTHFLVAPSLDHVVAEVERVVERHERYWVVEKAGKAGDLTEALDERAD